MTIGFNYWIKQIKILFQIYNRTWGSTELNMEVDLGDSAMNAVQARLRQLSARSASPDQAHLMHKLVNITLVYYLLCKLRDAVLNFLDRT